jgi:hypothetical protein
VPRLDGHVVRSKDRGWLCCLNQSINQSTHELVIIRHNNSQTCLLPCIQQQDEVTLFLYVRDEWLNGLINYIKLDVIEKNGAGQVS